MDNNLLSVLASLWKNRKKSIADVFWFDVSDTSHYEKCDKAGKCVTYIWKKDNNVDNDSVCMKTDNELNADRDKV